MRTITVDIKQCAACGKNHCGVKIKDTLLTGWDFIGKCPDTGIVLLIKATRLNKPGEDNNRHT